MATRTRKTKTATAEVKVTAENEEKVMTNPEPAEEVAQVPAMNFFEKVTNAPSGAKLPARATVGSAGYDFFSPASITIRPNDVSVIRTGVKAHVYSGNFLMIVPRSSMGIKNHVILANSVGIIDSDYYNNPDNEGEICIALYNYGNSTCYITAGDKIAQGIFVPYLTVDNDTTSAERVGGVGSTGK